MYAIQFERGQLAKVTPMGSLLAVDPPKANYYDTMQAAESIRTHCGRGLRLKIVRVTQTYEEVA